MAKDSDRLAAFEAEKTGGLLSGLLAEENDFDRRILWRIGSWGVGAVAAVTLAIVASQSSFGWRRQQIASADLARQAQQLEALSKQSQNETRRIAAAIDTLNNDRDRLFARVTVLEQGLDSVTGTIAKEKAAHAADALPKISPVPIAGAPSPTQIADASPLKPTPPPPTVAPVAATAGPSVPSHSSPAKPELQRAEASKPDKSHAETAKAERVAVVTPVAESSPAPVAEVKTEAKPKAATSASSAEPKSMIGPPAPAVAKTIAKATEPAKQADAVSTAIEPAKVAKSPPSVSAPAEAAAKAAPTAEVQKTEFAVDLGTANSVPGLRNLWRGLAKWNRGLDGLHPIIMVKEGSNGLGMQLRLAAGPLNDAAAAAKICVELMEKRHACSPTVFDGQRLVMGAEETAERSQDAKAAAPAAAKPAAYRHYSSRHARKEEKQEEKKEEPPPPPPPPPPRSTLSTIFGWKH